MSAIGERQLAAIARIEFPGGQGTGFAVARDRLLTAGHVLANGRRDAVACFGAARIALDGPQWRPPPRDDRDDWVLVACAVPKEIEPLELASQRPTAGRWRSCAYPAAAHREVFPAGDIAATPPGLYVLSLAPDTLPGAASGASGAPVFVDERAVGLLIEHRGNAGGLLAIDAATILATWPDGQPRPTRVPREVPFEAWVTAELSKVVTDDEIRRIAADRVNTQMRQILDPSDVNARRLARLLLTSHPQHAVAILKTLLVDEPRRRTLIDLACSLWVHHGAARQLGDLMFTQRAIGVLRCAAMVPMRDHLCCAEGLVHDGLPRCREDTLVLRYEHREPAALALWPLVRNDILCNDVEPDQVSDDEVLDSLHDRYAAIAISGDPPAAALDGLLARGVALPIVVYSAEANHASAASCGGVLIEPTPDPERARRALRLRDAQEGKA